MLRHMSSPPPRLAPRRPASSTVLAVLGVLHGAAAWLNVLALVPWLVVSGDPLVRAFGPAPGRAAQTWLIIGHMALAGGGLLEGARRLWRGRRGALRWNARLGLAAALAGAAVYGWTLWPILGVLSADPGDDLGAWLRRTVTVAVVAGLAVINVLYPLILWVWASRTRGAEAVTTRSPSRGTRS